MTTAELLHALLSAHCNVEFVRQDDAQHVEIVADGFDRSSGARWSQHAAIRVRDFLEEGPAEIDLALGRLVTALIGEGRLPDHIKPAATSPENTP